VRQVDFGYCVVLLVYYDRLFVDVWVIYAQCVGCREWCDHFGVDLVLCAQGCRGAVEDYQDCVGLVQFEVEGVWTVFDVL